MSKVYIVSNTGRDFENYSKLKEFGEYVFLTSGFVDLHKVEVIKKRIANLLVNADKDDYLVLEGSKLLCAITVLVWLQLFGSCQILQWNPRKGYEVYQLQL